MKPYPLSLVLISLLLMLAIGGATAQAAPVIPIQPQESLGTSFTYQARLDVDGRPAEGRFDLRFMLFAHPDPSDLKFIGVIEYRDDQLIQDGIYSTELNFGVTFDDQAYYLQISIRPVGQGSYVDLTPRQRISSIPNAQYAERAKTVTGSIIMKGPGDVSTKALIFASADTGYYSIYAISKDSILPTLYAQNQNGTVAYLDGDVVITGQLSQPAPVIQLEHPTDPQDKVLNLAVAGSTEQTVTASGNVRLGSDGSAVIQLPDWFTSVAGDLRYQLTPVGAPAPGLYVAAEAQNNQFRIAGGAAGLKISWQVNGTRQDAYEVAHPFQAEQPKAGKDVQ